MCPAFGHSNTEERMFIPTKILDWLCIILPIQPRFLDIGLRSRLIAAGTKKSGRVKEGYWTHSLCGNGPYDELSFVSLSKPVWLLGTRWIGLTLRAIYVVQMRGKRKRLNKLDRRCPVMLLKCACGHFVFINEEGKLCQVLLVVPNRTKFRAAQA